MFSSLFQEAKSNKAQVSLPLLSSLVLNLARLFGLFFFLQPNKNTNLDSVDFPSGQLQVIFNVVFAVFARAVKEVLRLQQPLPLLRQVQEVHVGNTELLSLRDLPHGTKLNPGEQQHIQSMVPFILSFI